MKYSIAGALAPTIETYEADAGAARERRQQGGQVPDELEIAHADLIAYLACRLDVSSEVALAALGNCLVGPLAEERRAKYVRANEARSGLR